MTTKVKRVPLPDFLEPTGTMAEFEERLHKEGYRRIGHGLFSEVYGKRGDKSHVIKVARGDTAYDDYLSVVMAHQENPYFPRVFDVKRFKISGLFYEDNVSVISMERLEKGGRKGKYKNSLGGHIKSMTGEHAWNAQKRAMKDLPIEFKGRHAKQMLAVMKDMHKHHGWLDLHKGNIMFRGEQPVIIDPVT